MNVFVLCTGRCGSTTFYEACRHMTNFTAGHESRVNIGGKARMDYPPNHIEADNRLSWFLGLLDECHGDEAFYVHLTRDRMETARSYAQRFEPGLIMMAYAHGLLMGTPKEADRLALSLDYCDTVNANIRGFLKDKRQKMDFPLEQAEDLYPEFWRKIGAQGDLAAARREWSKKHNMTPPPKLPETVLAKFKRKVKRRLGG